MKVRAELNWHHHQPALGHDASLQLVLLGYYNNEGKPGPTARHAAPYGGGPDPVFFKILEQWRAGGSFEGLEFDV